MTERSKLDDESTPADPERESQKGGQPNRKPRPDSRANKPEVTPLDPDKNLEEGIDVEER